MEGIIASQNVEFAFGVFLDISVTFNDIFKHFLTSR